MPIYEYRCEKGHTFEVMQKLTDDPVKTCEVHGTPVERVFHPVAVHFKGSGFYTTDYGRNRSAAASDSGSKDESKSDSKTEAAGSKPDSAGSGSDSGASSSE
jgi:putative FmdB family regulatory protein